MPIRELAFIDSATQAAEAIDPIRLRILARMRQPTSAAAVARDLGMPRQRLGYHIRALEKAGLIVPAPAGEQTARPARLLQSVARAFVLNPAILGPVAVDANADTDRFSSVTAVAAAAKTIWDIAVLTDHTHKTGKKTPSITIDASIRFASFLRQTAFADELASTLADLVAKYDEPNAVNGRTFRVVTTGYPAVAGRDAIAGDATNGAEVD